MLGQRLKSVINGLQQIAIFVDNRLHRLLVQDLRAWRIELV